MPRKEGWDKVTGEARYVDDMILPGMLYGATVRSNMPRGKIRKISFDPGVAWDDFVLVTAKDIPGKNYIALILDDQPCLASETVNHPEEPILLLAHADRHKLRKAVESVSIEYEPLPPVHTMEESEQQSTIIWGTDNTFKGYLVEKGDVDTVWKEAALIVEGEYFTGAQEQLYIENNGVIAAFHPENGITVWGSLQCPYYVHKALMVLCGLPQDKIRVVQMETGGAFGGKEEYPSMIAGHAALLSIKSGRRSFLECRCPAGPAMRTCRLRRCATFRSIPTCLRVSARPSIRARACSCGLTPASIRTCSPPPATKRGFS